MITEFTRDIILTGEHIFLEPMTINHVDGLTKVIQDGELWKLWYTLIPPPEQVEVWVNIALEKKEQEQVMPFVVRKINSGEIIGTTRFLNIEKNNRHLEIGSTFYAMPYQRTFVNTEAKLLLLTYAFEELKCIAVEFRTHFMNMKSRNAILRLGAKQDGILRNHMIMPDSTYRDTVAFSIIESEWHAVKVNLLNKLGRL